MHTFGVSNKLFSFALSFDPGLRTAISDYYYAKCQTTSGNISLALLKEANKYSNGKYNDELIVKLIKIADSQKTQESRESYIREAVSYGADKKTIFNSVIGMVIIFLAWMILVLIIRVAETGSAGWGIFLP